MHSNELDQRIEDALAVLETEQQLKDKISAQLAADRNELAEASADLAQAREVYASVVKGYAVKGGKRPTEPNAVRVHELEQDVALRAGALKTQLATLAQLESELQDLLTQRAHEEYTARARALASSLSAADGELAALVALALGGASGGMLAAESFEANGVLVHVGQSSVRIELKRPATRLHSEDVLAAGVHARKTSRLAAMLQARASARALEAQAELAREIAAHEERIGRELRMIRDRVAERASDFERNPGSGSVASAFTEAERELSARELEIHRVDAQWRAQRGAPPPSWTPTPAQAPRREEGGGPAPVQRAPAAAVSPTRDGWANA
jgi:hypothetical protein